MCAKMSCGKRSRSVESHVSLCEKILRDGSFRCKLAFSRPWWDVSSLCLLRRFRFTNTAIYKEVHSMTNQNSYQLIHFSSHFSCERKHCSWRLGHALHLLRADKYLACDSWIGLSDLCGTCGSWFGYSPC